MTTVLALMLTASAQSSNPPAAPADNPPSASQSDKQSNAASAAQDNSGISGDQVTKPAGAKGSTVIGCIAGPDVDGHFELKNMQYRSGVEVLGPDDLQTAAGRKVKLTGQWVLVLDSPDTANNKKNRRFQATGYEVLADKCSSPAETTPVSKKKQQQQKAAASQNPGNNPQ